jgi:hypothetical protein
MTNAPTDPAHAPKPRVEPAGATPGPRIRGSCTLLLAFDIAMGVDLDEADRRVSEAKQRLFIRNKRRAPSSFQYEPPPLRVTQQGEPQRVAGFESAAGVDCTLYDFGAVSIAYRFPLDCRLGDLLELSDALYGNERLTADARRRAEALAQGLAPALQKPGLSDLVEDYAVFAIDHYEAPEGLEAMVEANGPAIARILRSETGPLSQQEVRDALSTRLSYGPEDATIVDWNAAMLLGAEMEDVAYVLEYANVELLEMRLLDDRLDRVLEKSYGAVGKRSWKELMGMGPRRAEMARLAAFQADSALMFEGAHNALKLVGDQYLARVYRVAAQRLGLPAWDSSILRKLGTVESIYDKVSDDLSTSRLEILEWIIIILIAVSIVMYFIPGLY